MSIENKKLPVSNILDPYFRCLGTGQIEQVRYLALHAVDLGLDPPNIHIWSF